MQIAKSINRSKKLQAQLRQKRQEVRELEAGLREEKLKLQEKVLELVNELIEEDSQLFELVGEIYLFPHERHWSIAISFNGDSYWRWKEITKSEHPRRTGPSSAVRWACPEEEEG